eukprot:gene20229-26982_t
MRGSLYAVLLIALLPSARSFYIPGSYPSEFRVGDQLQVNVNSLTSFETDMPFEYYTMPFCQPPEGVHGVANTANPGTLIEGLRIENSPYNFSVKVKQTAQLACKPTGKSRKLTQADVENLKHKIDNRYRINMLLDNLPVTVYDLLDEDAEYVRPGFELGFKGDDGNYYINNHLVFNVLVYLTHGEYTAAREKYNDEAMMSVLDTKRKLSEVQVGESEADSLAYNRRTLKGGVLASGKVQGARRSAASDAESDLETPEAFYMIVGFEVSPCSIERKSAENIDDVVCGVDNDAHVTHQVIKKGVEVVYTYDVYWQDSNIKWASRWDAYLRMPGGKVHWFSIVNSILVVIVMASMVALILVRTVRRDLAKYEALVVDSSLDMRDEAGWKQLKSDIFRPPAFSRSLVVQVSTGVQIICTSVVSLLLASLGFLNPSSHGALIAPPGPSPLPCHPGRHWRPDYRTSVVSLLLASLGFLNPSSRGALITTSIVLYVWLAVLAGFTTVYAWGVVERTFNGWPVACATVSVFFPAVVITIFSVLNIAISTTAVANTVFSVLNIAISSTGSGGAVPLGTSLVIVVASVPLTFLTSAGSGGAVPLGTFMVVVVVAVPLTLLQWCCTTQNVLVIDIVWFPASVPLTFVGSSGAVPFGTFFVVVVVWFLVSVPLTFRGSSGAVPFGTFLVVVVVWFLVSVPLTFVGGYMALKVPILEQPVKTNQIPRLVPPQPISTHPITLFLAAGLLPFGTMFIELYFAMTSLWLGFFYYLFGFMFLIGLLAMVVNAEIAVLCTYVQLCAEDYHWWWDSFYHGGSVVMYMDLYAVGFLITLTLIRWLWGSFYRGGSVAMYMAIYAVGFLITSLSVLSGGLPVFIYICYMTIFVLGLYLAMGSVGFLASYWFVHLIFSAVKAD